MIRFDSLLNTLNPFLSGHPQRTPKNGFQDRLLFNAGQRICRRLQWEHSAILSTFIKLPFSIKTFVSSIFKHPHKTGFTIIENDDYILYDTSTYKHWTEPQTNVNEAGSVTMLCACWVICALFQSTIKINFFQKKKSFRNRNISECQTV